MEVRYIARVSDANGKRRYLSGPHYSREDAAREAFEARPKAADCSTSRATQLGIGDWRDFGFDIQFHRRDQIMSNGHA